LYRSYILFKKKTFFLILTPELPRRRLNSLYCEVRCRVISVRIVDVSWSQHVFLEKSKEWKLNSISTDILSTRRRRRKNDNSINEQTMFASFQRTTKLKRQSISLLIVDFLKYMYVCMHKRKAKSRDELLSLLCLTKLAYYHSSTTFKILGHMNLFLSLFVQVRLYNLENHVSLIKPLETRVH